MKVAELISLWSLRSEASREFFLVVGEKVDPHSTPYPNKIVRITRFVHAKQSKRRSNDTRVKEVAVIKWMRPFVRSEISTTDAACLRITVLNRSGRIMAITSHSC
jgi:hypothetical protein